jgi:hypothetical protein
LEGTTTTITDKDLEGITSTTTDNAPGKDLGFSATTDKGLDGKCLVVTTIITTNTTLDGKGLDGTTTTNSEWRWSYWTIYMWCKPKDLL